MTLSGETAAVDRARTARGALREISGLAYPVVLTQLSATAMGVVDSAMVGRLGATQLAAVGFGAVWAWTLFSLFFGTASAVQTFVAQDDGAGRQASAGAWAWQAAYGVLPAAALLVAVLLPMVDELIALLGTSPTLHGAASDYLKARLVGEVGFVATMLLSSFFRGFGDTRTPLYVGLFSNVVNAALDYGLIFGHWGLPAWGVAGAGAATAVGHWIAAAALYAAFRRRAVDARFRTRPVAPSRRAVRRFLRTGAPIGGQWFIGMTSFAIFTTVVAHMGDVSMAASQAFVMLLSLSFMQALGISTAASTLVGRYVGARDLEAAERSYRSALVLGIGLAGLVALVFVTLPGPLLRIFSDDPAVVALGRPLLLLGALFQLCDAVAIISEGSLRGAGDTRWPFLLDTVMGWGVFIPLAYFLGVTLGYGLTGAWLGGTLALAASSALLVRRFRSGAWKRIEI